MDTEAFSQSRAPPEPSEPDQANVENSSSELNLHTEEFINPKVIYCKKRNRSFRKGFSKSVPYINWRRNAQKRVSEHLAKGLCVSCKSQLPTGNAQHQESVASVVETKEQERPAEDIIERRGEAEVATVGKISMVNDHISDDLSEKTLAGSDEETRFEFVEEKLRRMKASTESDKREETEDGANTEDSDGGISTATKGGSETEHTNEAIAPYIVTSSPNSQRSTEKDGSTVELSDREQSEEVAIKKAEGLEAKSDEDHLNEIEQHILLKVVIFFWTSVRDFFIDSKYFLSKCTLPNSNGMALLR
jgi:hypothetical protein